MTIQEAANSGKRFKRATYNTWLELAGDGYIHVSFHSDLRRCPKWQPKLEDINATDYEVEK